MICDFTSSFTEKPVPINASDMMFQNTVLARVDNLDSVFTKYKRKKNNTSD